MVIKQGTKKKEKGVVRMNEECKYCDYVSECSRKCEYGSIICKLQRSFPKIVDKSYEQLQRENQELKEQLHEASLTIQEMTEQDIECPSNCEKLEKLQKENKKQKEVIDKIMNLIKQYGKYDGKKCVRGFQMWSADFNKILDMLKEVSE